MVQESLLSTELNTGRGHHEHILLHSITPGGTLLPFSIEFLLPVTIVIIPDVLVTNLITKLYQSCLVAMASQTMQAGMTFSITGTPNPHVYTGAILEF